jgi:hypothetical protein
MICIIIADSKDKEGEIEFLVHSDGDLHRLPVSDLTPAEQVANTIITAFRSRMSTDV